MSVVVKFQEKIKEFSDFRKLVLKKMLLSLKNDKEEKYEPNIILYPSSLGLFELLFDTELMYDTKRIKEVLYCSLKIAEDKNVKLEDNLLFSISEFKNHKTEYKSFQQFLSEIYPDKKEEIRDLFILYKKYIKEIGE
jgi:hypothetical protein